MPGMTGRYMIIKMSKRHREIVCNDSDYFKKCKMVTKLSNQSKSSKEEAQRREFEELLKFKTLLEEMLDDVNGQLEERLQKKNHHIADLTRRNAKLKSTDNRLRERLDKRKHKSKEQKIEISNLQHLNDEQNKILTDCKIKLETTEKQLLVAEEMNSQLQTKLEEAEAEMTNLRTKNHELEKESMFLAAYARTNTVLYDDGMDDSLNKRNCDLSDGDDNPPSEHLMQSDIKHSNIVVAETDQSDMKNISIVVAKTDNNVEQNPDSEDHCRLSSDDADKSETVPASAYSLKPNGMAPCMRRVSVCVSLTSK